jgi:Predicted restriction endonuclease
MAHCQTDTDDLIGFVRELQDQDVHTLAHGNPFRVQVTEKGLVYIPLSTGLPRHHKYKWLKRVCEEFSKTNSFKAGDYHHLSMHASYVLAVIKLYLHRESGEIGPPGLWIDVESQDWPDEVIDRAIRENRLRLGTVPTDSEVTLARQRRRQERLRRLTLLHYSSMCALCDINDPALLIASHIVGWAQAPEARGLLSNVLCLCRFHDILFEQGYWSLTDDFILLRKAHPAVALLPASLIARCNSEDHMTIHRHRASCVSIDAGGG